MTREELEALTKAELIEHAEVVGVTLGALDTKGTMISKITGDYSAPAKKAVAEEKLSPLGALHSIDGKKVSGRKWKLKIFSSENDSTDVDVIVNGHNLRIQRNQEVIVDEAYVKVLENAVVETVVQDPDTGVRVAASRLVYPYQASPV